jgi:hypothetical protein
LELRKIETAKTIASLLRDSNNKIMLDTNSLGMNLPISNDSNLTDQRPKQHPPK